MACNLNLFDTLSSADTGGNWFYDGYSASTGGPYGSNPGSGPASPSLPTPGSDTPIDGGGHTITVDFTGANAGFYSFTYVVPSNKVLSNCGDNQCEDCETVEIEVVGGVCTGPNVGATYCQDFGVITLSDELSCSGCPGGTCDSGTWAVVSGSPGVAFNAGAGTFDTTQASPGTYIFSHTVTATGNTHGFIDPLCENCEDVAEVTIDVLSTGNAGTSSNIAVCN